MMLKRGQIGMAKWPVADNQNKLVFTLFTIGYSGVTGAQRLRSLV